MDKNTKQQYKQRRYEFKHMNDTERLMEIHYAIQRVVDSDTMIQRFNPNGLGLDEIKDTLRHSLFIMRKVSNTSVEDSIADLLAMDDESQSTTTNELYHLKFDHEQRESVGTLTKKSIIDELIGLINKLPLHHLSDNQTVAGDNTTI